MFPPVKIAGALALALLSGFARHARAVPAFATQTGQPCATCHVGAFGPQLTPFGRDFKSGGYTLRGGDTWAANIPLAGMALGSFNRTASDLPPDQVAHHFAANNNPALDQLSVFIAGGLDAHTGGFIQITYSDVPNAANLDNTDLRPYVTSLVLGGHDLQLGTTVNNNPTVQDLYNATYAWSYPYVVSSLAPTPSAQPVLAGAFAQSVIGYTGYLRLDRALYLEAGAYTTQSGWLLARTGNALTLGSAPGAMPYLRAAYEWDWGSQNAHLGGIYFQSNIDPASGPFSASSAFGRDHYQDLAADVGWQWMGDGTHIATLQGIYTHEIQNLKASAAQIVSSGSAANGHNWLDQVRLDASYWYQNTYGATVAWQKSWGPVDRVLFQPGPLTGSANGRPNSNAFILEADWVPFGKADSWGAPWVNLKLGLQYTIYTEFNGGGRDYDGFGRSAGDNNTLFLFGWLAF